MAKVRYATYVAAVTVPATDTLFVYQSGLLRDILPDEPFKVLGLAVSIRNSMALGDTGALMLAKNVVATISEGANVIAVTHAVLAVIEVANRQAAGTSHSENIVQMFPQPLDFDRDDSLNVAMGGTNTDAGPQMVKVSLVLFYEVG